MAELEYFEGLLKNSRVNGVLQLDTEGNILAVSAAFTSLFGYTYKDVDGQNFSIFFTSEDKLKNKPQIELEKVLKDGQCDDKNYIVHKNGQITWVSGESILISSAKGEKTILKIIQDIRQQKEFEFSLSRANDLRQSILATIADAVVVLNKQMHIVMANAAFYRLVKNEHPSFADFAAIINAFDANGILLEKIKHVMNTGEAFSRQQIEIFSPKGEKMFEVSCHPMLANEIEETVLLVAHDITAQKRAQIEREDIMGFVAHELRNPLANILLTNEMMAMLLQNQSAPEFATLLQKSKNNITRLNKMITELYDSEKVNAGRFELDITTFNIDEMLKEAVETTQALHPMYNIIQKGAAGIAVKGDRYRLMQVVTNYLSNGIKYSNGEKEVTISVSKNNNSVIVCVEDKGLGISADQLPYIFDRFFRAEKTRNLEGIGLGLYLCRRIMDAHNGRVWAESEDGKGSRFYLSLPIV